MQPHEEPGFHPSKEGFKDTSPHSEEGWIARFHPSKEGFKGPA